MVRFCGLFALLAAQVALAAAQQTPVFRGAAETVPVHVTVIEKSGRLVPDLAREDFEIRDNGRKQPITVFDNSPQPIRLIVLLDVSTSMIGNLPLLRKATTELLSRIGPDDLVRIGTFGQDITFSPKFTNDRNELLAALPTEISDQANTPMWTALDKAMSEFQGIEGRRVILLLSDGRDTGPPRMFRDRYLSFPAVLDRGQREGFMFYAVAMESRGAATSIRMGEGLVSNRPDPGLARLARDSGGGYFEIGFRDDLGTAFARVIDELRRQYLIGFKPPQADGKLHDIEVKVLKPDMTPRARK